MSASLAVSPAMAAAGSPDMNNKPKLIAETVSATNAASPRRFKMNRITTASQALCGGQRPDAPAAVRLAQFQRISWKRSTSSGVGS